ncbi:hypothetical protein [Streptomyces sp. NPDC091371]|uniref:P-type ATPase n=1 Tax=Streptomyces sp. NPDC091371 TaxID=3155303 RepID=UPI003434C17F
MPAQIIRLVQQAQASKTPIQRLADAVSACFVPAVIAIPVASFAIWHTVGPAPALTLALFPPGGGTDLACPCALAWTPPLSVMAGTGNSAEAEDLKTELAS